MVFVKKIYYKDYIIDHNLHGKGYSVFFHGENMHFTSVSDAKTYIDTLTL